MLIGVIFTQLLLAFDVQDERVGGSCFSKLVHAHISRMGGSWEGEGAVGGDLCRGLSRG